MKRFFKILFLTLVIITLVNTAIFLIYSSIYYKAENVDNYLKTDEYVTVIDNKDYIAFMPNEGKAKAGYIFYPGAKVEEKAYSELMYDLAKLNIFAAIVKMPFRFAFLNIDGANKVINDYHDDVDYFYIGGHSLGGAMSTVYLSDNQDRFEGFILLGAYTTKDFSSNEKLWGLIIYGSNDYVLNRNSYAKADQKMPKHKYEYVIDGGNHANFASYGVQKGDGEATITRTEQINSTVFKIVEFITLKQLTLAI